MKNKVQFFDLTKTTIAFNDLIENPHVIDPKIIYLSNYKVDEGRCWILVQYKTEDDSTPVLTIPRELIFPVGTTNILEALYKRMKNVYREVDSDYIMESLKKIVDHLNENKKS